MAVVNHHRFICFRNLGYYTSLPQHSTFRKHVTNTFHIKVFCSFFLGGGRGEKEETLFKNDMERPLKITEENTRVEEESDNIYFSCY